MKAVIADVIMSDRCRADPSLAAQSTEQLAQFTRLILIVIVHAPRDLQEGTSLLQDSVLVKD